MKLAPHFLVMTALVVVMIDEASSSKASAQPATSLAIPCKYPHGWSSTDASRDVGGIPPGYDHQCLVEYRPPDLIIAPCAYREVFSSINWSRVLDRPSVRVEYQCSVR
jgi:hypothetical protein